MIEIRDDWIFLLKMTPRHWPTKLNSALKLHWSGGLRISTVNSITNHYNSTFRASSAAVSQARTPASCPPITPSSTGAMSRTGPSRSFSNRKLFYLTIMRLGYSTDTCHGCSDGCPMFSVWILLDTRIMSDKLQRIIYKSKVVVVEILCNFTRTFDIKSQILNMEFKLDSPFSIHNCIVLIQ